MFKKLMLYTAFMALAVYVASPAWSMDEDAGAFAFIPDDSDVVFAIDMDRIGEYRDDVENSWRDADVHHFWGGMNSLSTLLTENEGKPDFLTFFGHLSGVQAFCMNAGDSYPFMVFSADSERDLNLLVDYTIAYLLEEKYDEALDSVESALSQYYYRNEEGEDGENVYHYDYPATLDDLVEFGFLEAVPVNPYTGEPMAFLLADEYSLGDCFYKPCMGYGCCGESCDEEEMSGEPPSGYPHYKLMAYHIGGTMIREPYDNTFIPGDIELNLRRLERMRDLGPLGYQTVMGDGWAVFKHADFNFAFGYSGTHLLFGRNIAELETAFARAQAGDGFTFDTPSDWDTSGAFYRDQTDLSAIRESIGAVIPPEIPSDITSTLLDSVGFEALDQQHTAAWIEEGEIRSIDRYTLTGDAPGSLIGSLMSTDPVELMTAENGPFNLIGELAWANPGEYFTALMEYTLEYVLPIALEMGGMEGMDPMGMLDMIGMGDFSEFEGMTEMYMLFTESSDRGDGRCFPGALMLWKVDSTDLAYIDVQIMDSLSFMVPDFPLYMAESEDDYSATWLMSDGSYPISPTVAWTDGWVVESLFREDALAAVDALENGEMFEISELGAANSRLIVHRQELMNALGDIFYACPEDQVAMAGFVFSLAGQLSGEDEGLMYQCISHDGYVEAKKDFSIGLFEDLLPALAYVMRGIGAM